MSEIPPISPQPPLSGVRKVDGEKSRQQSRQQSKQSNKPKPLNNEDDGQDMPHIDEMV